MKEHYKDIVYEDGDYFIKGFGISQEQYAIKGGSYRKLDSDPNSLFRLFGYLRLNNESIFLLPFDYDKSDTVAEKKIFDFHTKKGDQSKVLFNITPPYHSGVISVFLDSLEEKSGKFFRYKLVPYKLTKIDTTYYEEFLGYQHLVDVSKERGIMKITTIQEKMNDTIIECRLIPKIDFVYHGWKWKPI